MIDYDKEIKKLHEKIKELETDQIKSFFKDKYLIINHINWAKKDGETVSQGHEYFKKPHFVENIGEYIYDSDTFTGFSFYMSDIDHMNKYLFTKKEAEDFANNSPFPDIIRQSTFLATDFKPFTSRFWAFDDGGNEDAR